tara:strand:- start:261 stop:848 length:588 start_codon:yes stop_codon:yes gene_type:complete
MLANLVCSLIKDDRIKTTVAKAKAARVVAEKMVTLGKKGTLHHRRLAAARLRAPQRKFFPKTKGVDGKTLRNTWRNEHDVVHKLFDEIAPKMQNRQGGYTRIVRLAGARKGDAAEMAYLTWIFDDVAPVEPAKAETPTAEAAAPAAEPKAEEPTDTVEDSAPAEAKAEESAEAPAEEAAAEASEDAKAEEPKEEK